MSDIRPVNSGDASWLPEVAAWQDWSGMNPFQRFNWRDFTVVRLSGEWAPYTGTFELEAGLMGFNVMLTWALPTERGKAFRAEARAWTDRVLQSHAGEPEVITRSKP